MNIYFLVEGKRTEAKVYPKWLEILVPQLTKVQWYHEVHQNNYCVFSGNGYPSLYNHLKNSIKDVNSCEKFDYFVLCLDADEQSTQDIKQEVMVFLQQEKIQLNDPTKLKIIVQNKCIETWFLGHAKIFKTNPHDPTLAAWTQHYNVKENDPEYMQKPDNFQRSTASFHLEYFKKMLAERHLSYSKLTPKIVMEEAFLKILMERQKTTNHLQSFKDFIDFCTEINVKLKPKKRCKK